MLLSVQVCRVIAALLVVLYHCSIALAATSQFGDIAAPLAKLFAFGGQAGVAFFFVLSGFIIAYVHAEDLNRPGQLPSYLVKRATRIYPTYWIVFLAVYGVALATPSVRDKVPQDALVVLRSLLLLPQDARVVGGTGAPVLIVAWSLQFEIVFYAAFAAAILDKRLFYGLLAVFFVNLAVETAMPSGDFPRTFFASPLILLFAMGMLAATVARSPVRLPRAPMLAVFFALAFAGVAALSGTLGDRMPQTVFDLGYGISGAGLVLALARSEGNRDRGRAGQPGTADSRAQSTLLLLADSSYALYLIHYPLVSVLSKVALVHAPKHAPAATTAFVLIVALCVLASVVFHVFVERPILRLLKGWTHMRSPPQPQP